MAFNLGAFAGGVGKGYVTMEELAQRQKEQELRQQMFELQKAAADREATKFEQEQAAGEIYKQSAMPVGQEGTGVSVQQAVNTLGSDQTPGSQAPAMTDAGRAELTAALSKLPPEQATQALRAYQSMATPTEGGIDIGKATVYKGEGGMPMATNQTKTLSGLEQAKRFKDLAMASGNITAIEKANAAYNQAFQTAKLEREQRYDAKLDEYSDMQANVMHALHHLPDVGLEKAPELVNKDLKAFGLTAKYIPPTGDAAKKQAIGGMPMGMVEVRDSAGKVVGTFNSVSDIQAALNSHMEDYQQKSASDLAAMLPNAADRIKFMQDAQRLSLEKAKLKLTERGVVVEEDKATQGKRELDEKIKANLFGAQAKQALGAANASNAHAGYFSTMSKLAQSNAEAGSAMKPYMDKFAKLTPEQQNGAEGEALLVEAATAAAKKTGDVTGVINAITKRQGVDRKASDAAAWQDIEKQLYKDQTPLPQIAAAKSQFYADRGYAPPNAVAALQSGRTAKGEKMTEADVDSFNAQFPQSKVDKSTLKWLNPAAAPSAIPAAKTTAPTPKATQPSALPAATGTPQVSKSVVYGKEVYTAKGVSGTFSTKEAATQAWNKAQQTKQIQNSARNLSYED